MKTNAMRILDDQKINYHVLTYDSKDGKIDGVSVAEKVGRPPESVYKTLVAQGASKELCVFILPVYLELDLKKAAAAVGEKKVEMIAVKDITKYTGYIRGGCSPLGMKKTYKTIIDESAASRETFIVSGGKIGIQIELSPEDLANTIGAAFANIVRE